MQSTQRLLLPASSKVELKHEDYTGLRFDMLSKELPFHKVGKAYVVTDVVSIDLPQPIQRLIDSN